MAYQYPNDRGNQQNANDDYMPIPTNAASSGPIPTVDNMGMPNYVSPPPTYSPPPAPPSYYNALPPNYGPPPGNYVPPPANYGQPNYNYPPSTPPPSSNNNTTVVVKVSNQNTAPANAPVNAPVVHYQQRTGFSRACKITTCIVISVIIVIIISISVNARSL
mmetsp:Transcript_23565/g.27050  ORF Transcript_23565/g.27050 Transcript_23565/m.27050 type:complete len:162 (-) Transcript_23565:7-492(-)